MRVGDLQAAVQVVKGSYRRSEGGVKETRWVERRGKGMLERRVESHRHRVHSAGYYSAIDKCACGYRREKSRDGGERHRRERGCEADGCRRGQVEGLFLEQAQWAKGWRWVMGSAVQPSSLALAVLSSGRGREESGQLN